VGYRNMPSRIAVDASALYARNLLSFVTLFSAKEGGQFKVNWEDDIIRAVALTRDGSIVHPQFKLSTT
jgi:H+-translocating NAD(P) transhydrogenase subunit alpha